MLPLSWQEKLIYRKSIQIYSSTTLEYKVQKKKKNQGKPKYYNQKII